MSAQIQLSEIRHDAPLPREYWPEVDHLVTEDDTPVDNIFAEKQQRLLTEPLYSSWTSDKPFLAMSNVGLFYRVGFPPVVPDVLFSRGVQAPEDPHKKENRSYFMWMYGKPPDAVVELISGVDGGEETHKMSIYQEIGVAYYVLWDPLQHLSKTRLRMFSITDGVYHPVTEFKLTRIGLSLQLWRGRYEDMEAEWLRWSDLEGNLIPTGRERADAEEQRAKLAEQRASTAEQRASTLEQRVSTAEERAERLAAKLRSLGLDPNGGAE